LSFFIQDSVALRQNSVELRSNSEITVVNVLKTLFSKFEVGANIHIPLQEHPRSKIFLQKELLENPMFLADAK